MQASIAIRRRCRAGRLRIEIGVKCVFILLTAIYLFTECRIEHDVCVARIIAFLGLS